MHTTTNDEQIAICRKDSDRIKFIDFAKALAIIMVLAIHNNIASGISTIFVLPIFFVASGMLFHDSGRDYKKAIGHYFKKLIVPFWLMTLLTIPFEMIRASILGYGDSSIAIPAFIYTVYGTGLIPDLGIYSDYLKQIMSYKEQYQGIIDIILPTNCHLWFLPAIFCAQVITLVVIRNNKFFHLSIWIPILLLLTFVEYLDCIPPLPYCLTRGFLGAAYMLVGYQLKKLEIFEIKKTTVTIFLFAITIAITCIAHYMGAINTIWIRNIYGPNGIYSGIMAFLAGVCSSYIVLKICYFFEHLTCVLVSLKRLLSLISIHSITVYLWHLIVFNLIYALYILATGEKMHLDQYKMSVIDEEHWVFLSLLVLFTCIFLAYVGVWYKSLKNKLNCIRF